jgi:predicted PurR-regulated permease PerM
VGSNGDSLRRNRIILIAIAVGALLWLAYQARGALLPFALALALGYLLAPLIDRLSRVLPRAAAILLVYLLFFGALVGLGFLIVPGVASQVTQLIDEAPRYGERFTGYTRDVQNWYASLNIPAAARTSLENSLRNSADTVLKGAQTALLGTLRALTQAVGFIFGLFVIPFWLFYVMLDKEAARGRFYQLVPRAARTDVRRILRIASDVLNDYIRGQLLLGLVVGAATTVGLLAVGQPYWLLLGVVNGFMELIPVLGPIIGAVPGLIVAALTGDWGLFVKVALVYALVQLLENNLLVPKIQGDSVKLHPAIIILALILGGEIAGLPGVIMAVPVTAIVRDVYLYLYRRLAEGYAPREAEAMVPSRQVGDAAGADQAADSPPAAEA